MKPIIISGLVVAECGISLILYSISGKPLAALGFLMMFLGGTPLFIELVNGMLSLRKK